MGEHVIDEFLVVSKGLEGRAPNQGHSQCADLVQLHGVSLRVIKLGAITKFNVGAKISPRLKGFVTMSTLRKTSKGVSFNPEKEQSAVAPCMHVMFMSTKKCSSAESSKTSPALESRYCRVNRNGLRNNPMIQQRDQFLRLSQWNLMKDVGMVQSVQFVMPALQDPEARPSEIYGRWLKFKNFMKLCMCSMCIA